MKQVLIAGLLFVAATTLSTPAMAETDWYQFNFQNATCQESSTSIFTSPQAAIDWLRSQGETPTTQITRNPADNSIMTVEIDFENLITNTPASFDFFASDTLCEGFRQYLISKNIIADPNELK